MKRLTSGMAFLAITASLPALSAEINLNCVEAQGKNYSKIFIDTDSGKGSIEMNGSVLHICEVAEARLTTHSAVLQLKELGH